MTIDEMQKLEIGTMVKCQVDDDPTLEEGVVVNLSRTRCQVFGKDPNLPPRKQGFLAWLSAADIVSVVRPAPTPIGRELVTVSGIHLVVKRNS